jgi:biotin-dependent carboxylase-like uncharacterized protein
MITVLKPGLLTTVQDSGRWGHQHVGIPVAGPMDPWSHARANRLVGNDQDAATLEITLIGPRLRFETPAVVALSGGSFTVQVEGRAATMDRPVRVAAGQEIDLGRCTQGARAYLAIRGGVDVPPVFGSRATHLPSAMGGVSGRALIAGDVLRIGSLVYGPILETVSPRPAPSGDPIARVLPGPDEEPALAGCLEALISSRFEVSSESNRMGYRLRGARLEAPAADRLSTPTPMGTIQVPEGGSPIVLMADRQTTGGYPRVAAVISADLGIVGQLKPGDWVRFARCSHADALAALGARVEELDA